jgi:hypothetical protein
MLFFVIIKLGWGQLCNLIYINIIKKITRGDSRTLWAAHEGLSGGQMSLHNEVSIVLASPF